MSLHPLCHDVTRCPKKESLLCLLDSPRPSVLSRYPEDCAGARQDHFRLLQANKLYYKAQYIGCIWMLETQGIIERAG